VKKIGQRSEPQLQPGTNQDSDCGDGQKGQKDQKNLAGQSGKETTDQGDSDDQVECDDQGDSDDSGNQSDKKKQPESKRSSLSDRLTEKEKEEATRGEVRALTNEGKELTESENDAAKAEMKKILAIAERASGMGSGSSRLLRELKENALVTEANWGRLIDYIAKLSHDESSWSYPHRRFIHSGQYLPSLRGRRSLGDIIIALDSSGSIDDDTWASYMASFRSLLEQYKIEKVTVIVCDDRIQGEVFQDIRPEEMEDIKNLGKGGTDFNPPFDWIDREGKNVDLLIYFTDLQCNRYPCDPGYPVVWTAWQSYSRNQIPPFGEVIRV
jgi:predicted metal-dependent peptidase